MKKIAVKLTDISRDFIKALPFVEPNASDVSEADIFERKNGNIIYKERIYKQTPVRDFWKEYAFNFYSILNKYISKLGKHDIVYNFLYDNNGKFIKELGRTIANANKEDKIAFYNKENIIIGDKYAFELTDETYDSEMQKQDINDQKEQDQQQALQLDEKDQKQYNKLKRFIDSLTAKINKSIDRILQEWDQEKWEKLQEKIYNQLEKLQNKKTNLNTYFTNVLPAQKLIDQTIQEIEQQLDQIDQQNNVDLDVWDDEQGKQITQETNTTEQNKEEIVNEENEVKNEETKENNGSSPKADSKTVEQQSETTNVKEQEEQLEASDFITKDFKDSRQKTNYVQSFIKNNEIIITKKEFNKLDNSISSLVSILRKNKWKIKVA